MNCQACGAEGASEMSGREKRIGVLKDFYKRANPVQRANLATRIMDEVKVEPVFRCAECAVCACCLMPAERYVPCGLCRAACCTKCAEPAAIERDGVYVPAMNACGERDHLCWRCDVPGGGHNALRRPPRAPAPAAPYGSRTPHGASEAARCWMDQTELVSA